MPIVKIAPEEARHIKGVTDAEKLQQKTDEAIEEAARHDPDSALPTEEELKEFKRRSRDEKNN